MKIKWLFEAKTEYHDLLNYYLTSYGKDSARKFSEKVLSSVRLLEEFPEMGVVREDLLIGKYGFRSLFIGNHVCIYRIEKDTVLIYHMADARTNYIYNIFGVDPYAEE